MPEAEGWIAAQPKLFNGRVSIQLLIDEGRRRGYCICPRPLRQMVNVDGFTCSWCGQTETRESWAFWYAETDKK